MNWLLVSQDGASSWSQEASWRRINHPIRTSGKPWTIVARLNLFTEVSVNQTPRVLSCSLVQRGVKKGPTGDRKSLVIILKKFPFEIWFYISAVRTSAIHRNVVGSMKCGELHSNFQLYGCPNNQPGVDQVRSVRGNRSRKRSQSIDSRDLRQEVEFSIGLAFVYSVSARNVKNRRLRHRRL